MPIYHITPSDVLFFRDGRPMEAAVGSGGHGAHWPEPSILFDALHAALHRAFPANNRQDHQPWEHAHHFGRNGQYPARNDDNARHQRFGSLVTAGPFPCVDIGQGPQWLFPCPADVLQAQSGSLDVLRPMRGDPGENNLPQAPLTFPLASRIRTNKGQAPRWWSRSAMDAYSRSDLAFQPQFREQNLWDEERLFGEEWTTGIGLDPLRETQDRQRIYSAEYLRLRATLGPNLAGVALGLHAQMPMKAPDGGVPVDRLDRLFPTESVIICGGQQRACHVRELKGRTLDHFLPVSSRIQGERVKWTLLSPAVFPAITEREVVETDGRRHGIHAHPGGWLPTWIAPQDGFRAWRGDREEEVGAGRVLLKRRVPRGNRSREDWRVEVRKAPFLDCRLVAARIPKPIVISGWSERHHLRRDEAAEKGPKRTLLAVPAGSVYYFEGPDAPELAGALAWHGLATDNIHSIENRRSSLLGEKGFGLGLCGDWQFHDEAGCQANS